MTKQKEVSGVLERPEPRKEFLEWFQNAENIKPGTCELKIKTSEIEVAERLIVGEYFLGEPEVAIVKNPEGRIFAVPEDRSLMSKDRLLSRWTIHKGMKLRVTVDEEGIPEVLIIEN